MIKPYNKKTNPVRAEQFNTVDLDGCEPTATGLDIQPQSEIQSMLESLNKQILILSRFMSYLETRLKPILNSRDSEVDEITFWENINNPVETFNTVTLVGNQLEPQSIRLSLVIDGVNSIINRLRV